MNPRSTATNIKEQAEDASRYIVAVAGPLAAGKATLASLLCTATSDHTEIYAASFELKL